MNKKVMIAVAVTLTVGTIVWLNKVAIRTQPVGQRIKEINTGAAMAAPKAKAEEVRVSLVGITTLLNQKKALLSVQWPAGTSTGWQSYILSEGQSQDGITIDSIDVTNSAVTLRVLQGTRTIRLEKGA
jgi:hypothetical protein